MKRNTKKMKLYNITLLITLTLILTGFSSFGQNTVSPLSIFGAGEIQSGGFGTNKGMGGAGIALESGNYLNNLNPASYAGMDSLRIILEFGIEGKAYNLQNTSISTNGFNANLAYVAMGFKYSRWMAGSFGVVPFSSIGYSLYRINDVEGMYEQYVSNYVGKGGITRFYYANAIRLFHNLSLGVNVSYMFGTLTQQEDLLPTDIVPDILIERKDYLHSPYFDFGLQYKFNIAKTDYSLGLTYAIEQSLNSRHYTTVYDNSSSVIQSDSEKMDYLVIPETIGTGLGIKGKNYKVALDYTYQGWKGLDYPMQYDEFKNLHKVAAGLEIKPWDFSAMNKFYQNWTYRCGVSYESSYIQLNGSPVTNQNVTIGFGIPMYGDLSKIDFSITGGVYGTATNKLMNERYLKFNLGISFNELAFLKRVIE